jgi:hypothetical protein
MRNALLTLLLLAVFLGALIACGARSASSAATADDDASPAGDDDLSPADDDDDDNDNDNDDNDAANVDPSAPGVAVPADFLGISVEWDNVPDYLGDGAGAANAVTVQLLRNFAAEAHRPGVRIGGNSEDESWWNPAGLPRPHGVTIDLTSLHMTTLAALQSALDTKLILGLNLGVDQPSLAAAEATGALASIPREAILAFELGNEPDYYYENGWRGLLYNWPAYVADFNSFRDGVAGLLSPAPPFAAPALGGWGWLGHLTGFMTDERGRVAVITTHAYPFTICNGIPAPAPQDLLLDLATSDIGRRYAPFAAAAHADDYVYRMGEMNSISCGGADGVSNVYAAALWGADVAFELAAAGLDGLNFHTPANYAVFDYDNGVLTVRPLYYGMRFFSLATAQQGKLLPVQLATAGRVRAWATLGDDGVVRVALINEDMTNKETIGVRVAGRSGNATLLRLRAPAIDAKTGLTLGGQTWDGSTDGLPLGALTPEAVSRNGDAYVVPLPALEAVVVSISGS